MCGRPEIVFFKIDPVRTNSSRREKPWFWITQVDISIENGTTKILERSSCARSHVYPADCTGNSTNRDGFRKVAICYYAFLAVARLDTVMKPADRQESPGEDVGSDAPDWGFFSAVVDGQKFFWRMIPLAPIQMTLSLRVLSMLSDLHRFFKEL